MLAALAIVVCSTTGGSAAPTEHVVRLQGGTEVAQCGNGNNTDVSFTCSTWRGKMDCLSVVQLAARGDTRRST